MKKIVIIVLSIIVLLILGVVLYLGYLGFIPGISSLFGSDKPRDLGVVFTTEDYKSIDEKSNVDVTLKTGTVDPATSFITSGSKSLENSFTGAELTAMMQEDQKYWRYYPVSDVQIKIYEDGSVEMSGMLNIDRLAGYTSATKTPYGPVQTVLEYFKILPKSIPFYLSGTPTVQNNSVSSNFGTVELGRAKVPETLIETYRSETDNYLSTHLSGYDGLDIKSVDFNNGQLNFEGKIPEKIEAYKD